MQSLIALIVGAVLGAAVAWISRAQIAKDEVAAASLLKGTIAEVKAGASVVETAASGVESAIKAEKP